MEVADSPLEQISTCLETLDFPVRAGREMRIAAISIGLSRAMSCKEQICTTVPLTPTAPMFGNDLNLSTMFLHGCPATNNTKCVRSICEPCLSQSQICCSWGTLLWCFLLCFVAPQMQTVCPVQRPSQFTNSGNSNVQEAGWSAGWLVGLFFCWLVGCWLAGWLAG